MRRAQTGEADGGRFTHVGNKAMRKGERDTNQ